MLFGRKGKKDGGCFEKVVTDGRESEEKLPFLVKKDKEMKKEEEYGERKVRKSYIFLKKIRR